MSDERLQRWRLILGKSSDPSAEVELEGEQGQYNRSKLSAIRSMVFCNGWYANQVSNKDPHMLALCPLHMTLIEKEV